MKKTYLWTVLSLITLVSYSQNSKTAENEQVEHNYGGWYCPDNLNGFPAVDIGDWQSVPVVNGRMATQEETQNGTSLIFIDDEKYPNAQPLDIKMPRLARHFCGHSRKEEIIIVIQAINVSNDSVVGFRYLNGGNGSARLNEVKFLSDDEIENITSSRFISFSITINATQDEIWPILTQPKYTKALQPIFDVENRLKADWKMSSEVNFKYLNAGEITSNYAGNMYGNMYIQIDCESGNSQYVEKFLLSEDEEAEETEFIIVCGPYGADFNKQKAILKDWAEKVKVLSEKM